MTLSQIFSVFSPLVITRYESLPMQWCSCRSGIVRKTFFHAGQEKDTIRDVASTAVTSKILVSRDFSKILFSFSLLLLDLKQFQFHFHLSKKVNEFYFFTYHFSKKVKAIQISLFFFEKKKWNPGESSWQHQDTTKMYSSSMSPKWEIVTFLLHSPEPRNSIGANKQHLGSNE